MRNLFLIVFTLNIVVFLFYYYVPSTENKTSVVLPENITKLVLLSEVDKASLTPEVVVAEAVSKKLIKKCFTIGPFREESKVIDFRSEIKNKVKNIGVRERVEKQHWRYWVYLPSASSKAAAVTLASNLARKGLKDYYVIARGEYKNSISLGHFKDKTLAEKRLKSIKKMSYKPEMQAIEKEYTLYWLDYVAKKGRGFSGEALSGFDLEESIHQFTRECAK